MKYSVLGKLFVGLACMMGVGCSNSEVSTTSESQLVGKDMASGNKDVAENIQASVAKNLTTYLQGFDDKLSQLKDKHAKLVSQAKEAEPGSKSRESMDAILKELKKKSEEVQFQIEILKSGKGEDQLALQTGMDKTLADLDQSYDQALAEFAG